jgi:hypothetical protein
VRTASATSLVAWVAYVLCAVLENNLREGDGDNTHTLCFGEAPQRDETRSQVTPAKAIPCQCQRIGARVATERSSGSTMIRCRSEPLGNLGLRGAAPVPLYPVTLRDIACPDAAGDHGAEDHTSRVTF